MSLPSTAEVFEYALVRVVPGSSGARPSTPG